METMLPSVYAAQMWPLVVMFVQVEPLQTSEQVPSPSRA